MDLWVESSLEYTDGLSKYLPAPDSRCLSAASIRSNEVYLFFENQTGNVILLHGVTQNHVDPWSFAWNDTSTELYDSSSDAGFTVPFSCLNEHDHDSKTTSFEFIALDYTVKTNRDLGWFTSVLISADGGGNDKISPGSTGISEDPPLLFQKSMKIKPFQISSSEHRSRTWPSHQRIRYSSNTLRLRNNSFGQ